MPVRFKYMNVEPNGFGLEPVDIFSMEDADLQKILPTKFLHPYAFFLYKFRMEKKLFALQV